MTEATAPAGTAPAAPVLDTERLVLRQLVLEHAEAMGALASDKRIADTTLNIPHPYGEGVAEAMISAGLEKWRQGLELRMAMFERASGKLCGTASLKIKPAHDCAELGYWVGVPYWRRGYGSEAAQALVDYGFRVLGLHRIEAYSMGGNTASGRILEKIGMRHEGTQRDGIKKWGTFHDTLMWAVLRKDLERRG